MQCIFQVMKAATNPPWGLEAQRSHSWRKCLPHRAIAKRTWKCFMKELHLFTWKSWSLSLILLNSQMWASSLSSGLIQISFSSGSQVRWGALRKRALNLNFKGFPSPSLVCEAADCVLASSSINMLFCRQMLTDPCCLKWPDVGHRFDVKSQHLCRYAAAKKPSAGLDSSSCSTPASAAPSWLLPAQRRERRHSQLLLSHSQYNHLVLEVWSCSGLLRKNNKTRVLQEEYQHCSFKFVDENTLMSAVIYISFCSKSFEQRTLNKISIIIRRNDNHNKLLKYQYCGKQSWQYQCDNYFKK